MGWVLHAASFCLGIVLCLSLIPARTSGRFWLSLGLGPSVGLTCSTSLLFLLMTLANGLSLEVLLLEGLITATSSMAIAWKNRTAISSAWIDAKREVLACRSIVVWLLVAALGAALALTITDSYWHASARPHGWWDAVMIWNVRAKFFVHSEYGLAHAFQLDLFSHCDYPLLLPLAVSRVWLGNGFETASAPWVIQLSLLVPMVIVLVSSVARWSGIVTGLVAGLVLLSLQPMAEQLSWQIADIPLGYFLLCALACLQEIIARRALPNDETGSLWNWSLLCGCLSTGAAWTKNEGVVAGLLIAGLMGLAIIARTGWKSAGRSMAGFLAGAGLPLLALAVFKLIYAPSNDLVADGGIATLWSADRWDTIFQYAAIIWDKMLNWPVLLGLLCAILLSWPGRKTSLMRTAINLAFLAGMLSAYLLAYLTSPHDLDWHVSTSLHRLVLQIWPSFVLMLFLIRQRVDIEADDEILTQRPQRARSS